MIEIFDLALIKTIDNVGPYGEGETATFDITVFNQGNVDAYSVEVTDYLNEGYSFDPAANAGWTQNGDLLEYTIAGPLAPGATEALVLNLTVEIPVTANVNSWYNEAEISDADNDTDPTNEGPTDSDSTPDNDPDNDNDLVDGPDDDLIFDEDDDNDNEINEDPNDPFGLGDDDEDDNDAAGISVVGGLGDTVWKDLDGDGIQDPGEPGVAGVIVRLSDCEGNVLATEITDENGFYFFNNLIPGDYQVSFLIGDLPAGCAFTQQNAGDDTLDSDVDLNGVAPCTNIQGGEYDSSFDAGLLTLVNIGDFVWHDLDGDGAQDAGEPGIPNVLVYLFDADNNLISVTETDAGGYYMFANLYPDTYYIAFGDPEGFDVTSPDATADDNDSDVTNFVLSSYGSTTDLFTIEYGQEDDLTFDAGYYMCVPIGELVWYDTDEDDIHDDFENGINGLDVNLYKLEGGSYVLYDSQVTGHKPGTASEDGYYKFCAPPGTYYVEVVMPPLGLVIAQANQVNSLPLTNANESSIDSDMTNNFGQSTTTSFTVLSGDAICSIGSGYYPMATVGNRVWLDNNYNGIQEVDEPKVAGITVKAFDMDNNMVGETVTNAEGEYKIEYLEKKEYYLQFEAPVGYGFTFSGAGNDDVDSDVDHSMGQNTTSPRLFGPGQNVINVDAGLAFGVLPLKWESITVTNRESYHELTWITSLELNVSDFEIERRLENEAEFSPIGKLQSVGNILGKSTYRYNDNDIGNDGNYYYRVKQNDLDGAYTYSDVVFTSRESRVEYQLYPNPTSGGLNIKGTFDESKTYTISIINDIGKVIRSSEYAPNTTLDVSSLINGVYGIIIKEGNTIVYQDKFIKI